MADAPELKPIEKQTKLHSLTENDRQIDWDDLPDDMDFKMEGKDTDPGSFFRALEKALKEEKFKDGDKKEIVKMAGAVFRKAIHNGFDASLLHVADECHIRKGALYVDMKDGTKLGVKLDSNATIEAGYVEKLAGPVAKARGAWETLRGAMRHGILTDILPAMTGDLGAGGFKNRQRIWDDADLMNESDDYTGSYEQNKKMVEWLRGLVKADNKDTIAKLRAPGWEKRVKKGGGKVEKVGAGGVDKKAEKPVKKEIKVEKAEKPAKEERGSKKVLTDAEQFAEDKERFKQAGLDAIETRYSEIELQWRQLDAFRVKIEERMRKYADEKTTGTSHGEKFTDIVKDLDRAASRSESLKREINEFGLYVLRINPGFETAEKDQGLKLVRSLTGLEKEADDLMLLLLKWRNGFDYEYNPDSLKNRNKK